MTSNNLISPMKFCYNTNSTLPKQCQSSRSVLQDGSRTFGLFWKEKPLLITEEIRYIPALGKGANVVPCETPGCGAGVGARVGVGGVPVPVTTA